MDPKTHAIEHLANLLQPYRLHDLADVCERLYQNAGDEATGLHEASLLRMARDVCREPVGGEDGFGDLTWRIGPDEKGLPYVRVQATYDNHSAEFTVAQPITAAAIARGMSELDGDEAVPAVEYLFEQLDEEDRADTLRYMVEDAQESLRSLKAADRLSHSARLDGLLRDAIARGYDGAAQDALDLGAEANRPDIHGNTALHDAARYGREHLIVPLFQAGAWVNELNAQGQSPLHLAAAHGSADCCLLLLACGADATARDRLGRTPSDMTEQHAMGGPRVHEHAQDL